ncbi:hypothetical protein BU25DRAFT_456344 [Macroventuria anomochaeta]|uniref:Uncharacterized protein n=1 Tax=Macroventuria anomochaeta TaxID=301207 RepID=A0ACB6S992_9PLEO|nr:uncharacterized protein BU25DRAFT_456344 [Macroventuria anomochaeta]KAF2629918.1 hypothetical protein BU25DRAFT_456344 [Macroventuria anomochaeta]
MEPRAGGLQGIVNRDAPLICKTFSRIIPQPSPNYSTYRLPIVSHIISCKPHSPSFALHPEDGALQRCSRKRLFDIFISLNARFYACFTPAFTPSSSSSSSSAFTSSTPPPPIKADDPDGTFNEDEERAAIASCILEIVAKTVPELSPSSPPIRRLREEIQEQLQHAQRFRLPTLNDAPDTRPSTNPAMDDLCLKVSTCDSSTW